MSNVRRPGRKAGEPFGPTLSTKAVLFALNQIGVDTVAFAQAYDSAPRGNTRGSVRALTSEQEKAVRSYNETRDFDALVEVAGSTTAARKLIGRAVQLGI